MDCCTDSCYCWPVRGDCGHLFVHFQKLSSVLAATKYVAKGNHPALGHDMQLRARSDVIQRLQERIDGMERSRLSVGDRCGISTGFPELDRLLADGGLRRGTLIEWLSDTPGSGAAT